MKVVYTDEALKDLDDIAIWRRLIIRAWAAPLSGVFE